MENKPKKYNKADIALVTFLALVFIFCLALITYFLIVYPIPLITPNGKGGLAVILMGFIFLGKKFWPHLHKKVLGNDQKTATTAKSTAPKIGWKGIPLLERIGIVVSIPIFVVTILFAFYTIIWGFFSQQLP